MIVELTAHLTDNEAVAADTQKGGHEPTFINAIRRPSYRFHWIFFNVLKMAVSPSY